MTTSVRPDAHASASLFRRRTVVTLPLTASLLLFAGCKCSGDPAERANGTHKVLAYAPADSATTEMCPARGVPDGAGQPPDASPLSSDEFVRANKLKVQEEVERLRLAALKTDAGAGTQKAPPPGPPPPNLYDIEKARLDKEKSVREAACDSMLRDMAAAKPASSADIAAAGYKERSQFEKQLMTDGPLIACNAVRLGSDAACRMYSNPNTRDMCIKEVGWFNAARRAPGDGSFRFSDAQMEDCTHIPKMNAAECAKFRDAARAGNAAGCPTVDPDVNAFCRAISSDDAKQCPSKRFGGCANDMKRQVIVAKSGLQGLIDANAPEKQLASAAMGIVDACDALAKAWKTTCMAGPELLNKGTVVRGSVAAPPGSTAPPTK